MQDTGTDSQPHVLTAFRDIHTHRRWGSSSVSGPGSTLETTTMIRSNLMWFIEAHDVQSLLDALCGEGLWISDIANKVPLYLGRGHCAGAHRSEHRHG